MKTAAVKNDEPAVQIVKVGHCPSLSGKSKLTYEIGGAGKDIQVRVVGNSAAGAFNPDWVGLDAIEEAFAKCRKGEPITAVVLDHLFRGKSMNTPFFVWAVLKAEGLVKTAKDSPRGYERVDPREFVARVEAQLKGAQNGQGASKAKKGKGEGATSRRTPQKSRT
jgi:hypothetical protein